MLPIGYLLMFPQGNSVMFDAVISSNENETLTAASLPSANDEIMYFDGEEVSSVVFVSVAGDAGDQCSDSGMVSITYRRIIPRSHPLRVPEQQPNTIFDAFYIFKNHISIPAVASISDAVMDLDDEDTTRIHTGQARGLLRRDQGEQGSLASSSHGRCAICRGVISPTADLRIVIYGTHSIHTPKDVQVDCSPNPGTASVAYSSTIPNSSFSRAMAQFLHLPWIFCPPRARNPSRS